MFFPLTIITALILGLGVSAQLNKAAQEAGKLYFGTATDNGELSNSTYFKILSDTREFGQLTPANGQKWEYIEPELNVFHFTDGEVVTKLAKKNKQILRCHNLVWYSQLADWVTSDTWTVQNLTAALITHVTREASHWAGQCYAWDVLNEALNEDGTYRNDTFLSVLGPSYIPIAFAAAARADPSAKLYYNDYNIESRGNKSTGVIENIVGLLRKEGVRIDGVGLQSHFVAGSAPTREEIRQNMQDFVDLGLEVAITELDVRLEEPENSTNLLWQKAAYVDAVGACLDVDRCVGVTVWDFYDPFSWVPGVFTGFGSADLWFANFTKHPAYYGILDLLKSYKKGHW